MSLEEDNNLHPAEIKRDAVKENPEIDNIVTLPERQELIDRVGLAAVGHAMNELPDLDRQVKVELENASIRTENENIRNELTGKLAADIMRETIMPAADTAPVTSLTEAWNKKLAELPADQFEALAKTFEAAKAARATATAEKATPMSETKRMHTIMEAKFGSMTTPTAPATPVETVEAIKPNAGQIGLKAVESALNNPSENIPEVKQEIPKHEVAEIRGEERWQHDFFTRLGARFERMKINIKSAPKWAALETMRRMHTEGAAKMQIELDAQKKVVEGIEAQLAKREADAKASSEKMSSGGLFDRLAAAKLEREKQNMLSKLENAKAKYGQIGAKLEFKNKKVTGYQERLGHQAEMIAVGVDQRLAGDKAAFETLTTKQEDLNQKLNAFKSIIEAAQNDLLLLEMRLKNKPEAAEKAEIKNAIEEAKKKITELLASHKNLGTEKARVQAMANRAQLFLSGWDGMRSETK